MRASLGLEGSHGRLLETLSKRETPVNVIVQNRRTVAAKKPMEAWQQVLRGQ